MSNLIELSMGDAAGNPPDKFTFVLDRPTREAIAKLLDPPKAMDGRPISDYRLLAGLFGFIADRSPPPDAVDVVVRPKTIRGALEKLGYRPSQNDVPDPQTLLRQALEHAKKLKAGGGKVMELSTAEDDAVTSSNPLMAELEAMYPDRLDRL